MYVLAEMREDELKSEGHFQLQIATYSRKAAWMALAAAIQALDRRRKNIYANWCCVLNAAANANADALVLIWLFGVSLQQQSLTFNLPNIVVVLLLYSLAINVISTFGLSIFWKTIRMIFLPFFTVFVRSSSWGNSNVTCTPSMKF